MRSLTVGLAAGRLRDADRVPGRAETSRCWPEAEKTLGRPLLGVRRGQRAGRACGGVVAGSRIGSLASGSSSGLRLPLAKATAA